MEFTWDFTGIFFEVGKFQFFVSISFASAFIGLLAGMAILLAMFQNRIATKKVQSYF